MNVDDIAREYVTHATHKKALDKMVEELKGLLKKAVEKEGVPDDKGHKWMQAGKYMLQMQKRQSAPYLDKQAAEDWAKERGIWEEVKVVKEELNEDALLGYIYQRRDDKDLEAQFQELHVTPAPTYAFQAPQEDEYNDY